MYHSSAKEPGLQPRRCDTLNSGPPSTSPRIPIQAAQISSAIHSVLEVRQIVTSSRTLRPILPVPANRKTIANSYPSQPEGVPRVYEIGESSTAAITTNTTTHNHRLPFVMLEPEDGSEITPSHHSRLQTQPGAMRSLGDRNSSRNRNPTDADWNQHRSIITRLYWDENLSMPVVRDYMKREHGFDAT